MKPAVEHLANQLSNIAPDVSILEDEGWGEGQSGGRCITDYRREVRFSRELTQEELQAVKKVMQEKDCPGWTPVSGYLIKETNNVYRFSTTWDSSD